MPQPAAHDLPKNVTACHELIQHLQGEIGKMQARIDWLARKLFGRSSPSKNASPAPACWPT